MGWCKPHLRILFIILPRNFLRIKRPYSHRRIHTELKEACEKIEAKFFEPEKKKRKAIVADMRYQSRIFMFAGIVIAIFMALVTIFMLADQVSLFALLLINITVFFYSSVLSLLAFNGLIPVPGEFHPIRMPPCLWPVEALPVLLPLFLNWRISGLRFLMVHRFCP